MTCIWVKDLTSCFFVCRWQVGDLKWSTRAHLPPAFENVFPIENGGCSNVILVFRGVIVDPSICLRSNEWKELEKKNKDVRSFWNENGQKITDIS